MTGHYGVLWYFPFTAAHTWMECECGWQSPATTSDEKARADHRDHVEFVTSTPSCKCWEQGAVLHDGHCCFADRATRMDEYHRGTPAPCGHFVEVA